MQSEKAREDNLRRRARTQGFAIRKSRVQRIHCNNLGCYMLVDTSNNTVAFGEKFDASLDDIEAFLAE